MTYEGLKCLILDSVNDESKLDLLIRNLMESEEAKKILRNYGFGVTGTSLLETVKEVIESYITDTGLSKRELT